MIEQGQSLLIDGPGLAHDQLIQKLFFGTEVVVDGRQIDPGFGNDMTEGSGRVSLFPEQVFRCVEDFALCFSHSIDSIIRLNQSNVKRVSENNSGNDNCSEYGATGSDILCGMLEAAGEGTK